MPELAGSPMRALAQTPGGRFLVQRCCGARKPVRHTTCPQGLYFMNRHVVPKQRAVEVKTKCKERATDSGAERKLLPVEARRECPRGGCLERYPPVEEVNRKEFQGGGAQGSLS